MSTPWKATLRPEMWLLQERIGLFRLFFILNIWIYNFWDVTFAFYLCELFWRQVTSFKLTFFRNLDLSINCDSILLADGICLCKAIRFILVFSYISRTTNCQTLPETNHDSITISCYPHLLHDDVLPTRTSPCLQFLECLQCLLDGPDGPEL